MIVKIWAEKLKKIFCDGATLAGFDSDKAHIVLGFSAIAAAKTLTLSGGKSASISITPEKNKATGNEKGSRNALGEIPIEWRYTIPFSFRFPGIRYSLYFLRNKAKSRNTKKASFHNVLENRENSLHSPLGQFHNPPVEPSPNIPIEPQ